MNEISSKTRLAQRAAALYYLQGRNMEDIAESLQTSRSSVSRLLSYARKTGIVEIRLHNPSQSIADIQQQLSRQYNVKSYIIPTQGTMNPWERTVHVARHAGRIIPSLITPGNTVGVAWGTTMAGVARHLTPRAVSDVTIVQLNGSAYPGNFGIGFVSDILGRFAEAFGGQVEPFPVPAFFDDPKTREAMWRERSVQRILEMQERMDIALFGIGSPLTNVPSHVYRGGYLDSADREHLTEQRVAGDVATVFFRGDGSQDGITLNQRSSGPPLDILRRTPRRVCVVGDPGRIEATRGALSAGLVTDLIIDEHLAAELASTNVQAS